MSNRKTLETVITALTSEVRPVISPEICTPSLSVLDLSSTNVVLQDAGDRLMEALDEYVDAQLEQHGVSVAIGRYDEDRVI